MPRFPSARILIIDDDPEQLAAIAGQLRRAGYSSVIQENNPLRAILAFSERDPDLVILNLRMRAFDGLYVLDKIRPLTGPDPYLPILVVAGAVSPGTREAVFGAGATGLIRDTATDAELMLRVNSVLETRMLHVELRHEHDLLLRRFTELAEDVASREREVLERLAILAEYREDSTGRHIRRVRSIVQMISVELGFEQAAAELVGNAALLHDIGKIAIRDDILQKPGPLTYSEFEIMKTHTRIGGKMLADRRSSLLKMAELIARFHHERWDGSGYEGLAGDEIPLEARITSVADVYDALRSARSYKERWDHKTAVGEIARLSGSHFDPSVLEAFMRIAHMLGGELA